MFSKENKRYSIKIELSISRSYDKERIRTRIDSPLLMNCFTISAAMKSDLNAPKENRNFPLGPQLCSREEANCSYYVLFK